MYTFVGYRMDRYLFLFTISTWLRTQNLLTSIFEHCLQAFARTQLGLQILTIEWIAAYWILRTLALVACYWIASIFIWTNQKLVRTKYFQYFKLTWKSFMARFFTHFVPLHWPKWRGKFQAKIVEHSPFFVEFCFQLMKLWYICLILLVQVALDVCESFCVFSSMIYGWSIYIARTYCQLNMTQFFIIWIENFVNHISTQLIECLDVSLTIIGVMNRFILTVNLVNVSANLGIRYENMMIIHFTYTVRHVIFFFSAPRENNSEKASKVGSGVLSGANAVWMPVSQVK